HHWSLRNAKVLPQCSLTVEQCFHLALPLFRNIAAHLVEQFAETQNLPPVSPVPGRNLLVDCKDSRSVIVIFSTHRVTQIPRVLGQCLRLEFTVQDALGGDDSSESHLSTLNVSVIKPTTY